MRGYKRIRIFPERDLRATRLELAVLDCSVMQRLRYVRQLGQSYLVFPTAEHTRLSHSIGALYWVSKMLGYLKENYLCDDNTPILKAADAEVRTSVLSKNAPEDLRKDIEVSWFEQLVRLFALVHDITHLPFGHTLEDQARLMPRHDEDPERIEYFFRRLKNELDDSPHLHSQGRYRKDWKKAIDRLLDQCMAVFALTVDTQKLDEKKEEDRKVLEKWKELGECVPETFVKYLMLVHDLVTNTICADLIDYLHRDTLFAGLPWTVDKALLSHLKIVERNGRTERNGEEKLYHIGVAVARSGKLRHDVLTAVLSLLRARYDVTEKIYYHHTKCAADALLEKIIRELGMQASWKELAKRNVGDEGLLQFLEQQAGDGTAVAELVGKLRSRRLAKAVYRIRRASDFSRDTREVIDRCKMPEARTMLEARLAEKCGLKRHQIIVACLPEKMQLKAAEALVEWVDGEVLKVGELPERRSYLQEVTSLTNRYRDLWSLTVYLDEDVVGHYASVLAKRCRRIFKRDNDALTRSYIEHRFEIGAEVGNLIQEIGDNAETSSLQSLNAASEGGSPSQDVNPRDVVLEELTRQVARERLESHKPDLQRKSKSRKVRKPKEKDENQATLLGEASEPKGDEEKS